MGDLLWYWRHIPRPSYLGYDSMTPETPDTEQVLEIFKGAMSSLASGVAVVTGLDSQLRPCGLTVTSIASYSADPPSVIICIDESAYSYEGLTQGEYFAVNLLREEQADIAMLFASSERNKFARCPCRVGPNQLCLIEDTLAFLICQRAFTATHGDHAVVIGEVVDGGVEDYLPLVYWKRDFRSVGRSVGS